jgi:ABC-type Mn2+/Zn2+ transport system permease subunit
LLAFKLNLQAGAVIILLAGLLYFVAFLLKKGLMKLKR